MIEGKRIGFIGAGNMAEALTRGLLKARLCSSEAIFASDVKEDRLRIFEEAFAIQTFRENAQVAARAEILLLAVKPQDMGAVLEGLTPFVDETKTLISIAAGVPIAFIAQRLAKKARIIRVMPNTPALVLEGAAGIAKGEHATEEDLAIALQIFQAVGRAVVVEERLLDAVTGLSGSGPAYVAVVVEGLADGGVRMGLPRDVALTLATQTVLGTARMILEGKKAPAELKDMVASPGGTTIAGLHALERGGLRAALMDAVEAATRRSQELGKNG
ncbi:MAG: pyrroline-5-carboxylate reductase [candidate division NC10 bacterium]|nr:pyrroline-5-carboxylate reductase [candidate division NC10 bacterium]